jgi:hypothetical protein
MEAVRTSETFLHFNVTTRRYIPEDSKLHTLRRENLKSHIPVYYPRNILPTLAHRSMLLTQHFAHVGTRQYVTHATFCPRWHIAVCYPRNILPTLAHGSMLPTQHFAHVGTSQHVTHATFCPRWHTAVCFSPECSGTDVPDAVRCAAVRAAVPRPLGSIVEIAS